MLMTKVNQKKILKTAGILCISFLFVFLSLKIDGYQKQLQVIENNQYQVSNLLYGEDRAPGFACGILTESRAETLVGVNLDRNFVQGPDNLSTENSPENKVFWTDNCRYYDPNDSSKYIELYINTYQNSTDATEAYPKIYGKVNEIVELSPEGLGDKLSYEGGAYYLLKDSRIIQVAASQGSESKIDIFSQKVLDELIGGLHNL